MLHAHCVLSRFSWIKNCPDKNYHEKMFSTKQCHQQLAELLNHESVSTAKLRLSEGLASSEKLNRLKFQIFRPLN